MFAALKAACYLGVIFPVALKTWQLELSLGLFHFCTSFYAVAETTIARTRNQAPCIPGFAVKGVFSFHLNMLGMCLLP